MGHDWNEAMEGIVLLGKARTGRQGSGVALYMSEQLESMQVCLVGDKVRVESLQVRIKGQADRGDIVVGVYYRIPDQEEEMDEAFYRQLQVASYS